MYAQNGSNDQDVTGYKVIKASATVTMVVHINLLEQIDDVLSYDYYHKKYIRGVLTISKNVLNLDINNLE